MRVSEIGQMKCPVARTLSIVGDPWTLLILRELFLGSRRFEEFQGYTGISPALLSSRLKLLKKHGIIQQATYRERPPRREYRLTEKGLDLYPLILAMSQWGSRWMAEERGALLRLQHRKCGGHTAPRLVCSECGEPISAREMSAHVMPVMEDDRRRTWKQFRERIESTPRHGSSA